MRSYLVIAFSAIITTIFIIYETKGGERAREEEEVEECVRICDKGRNNLSMEEDEKNKKMRIELTAFV